jgi:RNA polymerase sigma factor (sigma-70 family)
MFTVIFDRHYAGLYRYLRRRIGPEVAADLAAETFATAFARRAVYHPEGHDCRPWLYGIAHNLLRTHLRSERRQLAAFARHGADPLADAGAAAEFSLAEQRADAAAIAARLAGFLAELPDGDRNTLLLFAWADMSYAEVAQALGIPVGTVRSRLNRARRRLRTLLGNGSSGYLVGGRPWTS